MVEVSVMVLFVWMVLELLPPSLLERAYPFQPKTKNEHFDERKRF